MKDIYSRIPNYTKEEVINIWSDLFRNIGHEEMTLHCLCSKFDLPYDLNMFNNIKRSGDFENNIRRYLCRVSSLPQYVNYNYNTYEAKQDKELSDLDFIQMNKKSIKEKINKAMEDDNVGMVNKWINSYSNMVKLESELKPIRGLRGKNNPVDEACDIKLEEYKVFLDVNRNGCLVLVFDSYGSLIDSFESDKHSKVANYICARINYESKVYLDIRGIGLAMKDLLISQGLEDNLIYIDVDDYNNMISYNANILSDFSIIVDYMTRMTNKNFTPLKNVLRSLISSVKVEESSGKLKLKSLDDNSNWAKIFLMAMYKLNIKL